MTFRILLAAALLLSWGVQAALIPTEPQAIAAYALLAWAFIVVWVGNRNSGDDTDAGDATDDEGSVTDEDEISIKPPNWIQ